MPEPIRAFRCSFGCGRKILTSRKQMELHEARCFHNPIRRACQSCGNLTHDWETYYNPYHGGDPGSTDYEYKVKYCQAEIDIEKTLHSDCPQWITKP